MCGADRLDRRAGGRGHAGDSSATKHDPGREGPRTGRAARTKRAPATNNTSTLADYWAESPRHEGPNKDEIIPGGWIVVFTPGTANGKDVARDLTNESGGNVKHVYESALQGLRGHGHQRREVRQLADHPNVLSIERDGVAGAEDTQSPVTWGLDRVDQRDLPLSNFYADGT